MTNFNLNKCDVETILKRRFKISPSSVEPWFDSVIINANALSSQSLVNTWRFHGNLQTSGPVTSSKSYPFFVGWMKVEPFTDDPIGVTAGNCFAIVSNMDLTSIGTFYNLSGAQVVRFGSGTYLGTPFPAPALNVESDILNNPHFVVSPFMQVQINTLALAVVFLTVRVSFQGWKIFI